jgi:hypothetical protein
MKVLQVQEEEEELVVGEFIQNRTRARRDS